MTSAPLTEEQIRRYSRQILLPEVGGRGQKKLLAARVLVIGAGEVAEVAATYLAAAGVGTLALVAGKDAHPRTARLLALNPDVRVSVWPPAGTAQELALRLAAVDLVVDAEEDPVGPASWLAEACRAAARPLVRHGAVVRGVRLGRLLPGVEGGEDALAVTLDASTRAVASAAGGSLLAVEALGRLLGLRSEPADGPDGGRTGGGQ